MWINKGCYKSTICNIFRMAILKNISILILALCIISAYCQEESNITATVTTEKHQNLNQANQSKDHTAQPNIQNNQNPTHTNATTETVKTEKVEHEVKQDVQAYEKKIEQIRNQAIKSDNLNYQYIENKINQVIGSMSAQQKQQFQQNLSGEARAAYDHYRKAREQRDKKQQQEVEALKNKVQFTKQDEVLNAEKQDFNNKGKPFLGKTHSFNQLLFQMPPDSSEDFKFTLTSDQEIIVSLLNYMSENRVYSPVTTTFNDKPIWVYVYQNRDKLVAQASFFARGFIHFSGKINNSYLIRFVNHGKQKLVNLHISDLILQSHIQDKLTVEDVADHRRRISQVKNDLITRMNQSGDKWLLEEHNQRQLLLGFDHYYFYNIAEIVVLGTLCVIQVETARKLLANNNVI